jgi:hypothetical protein
MGKAEAAGLTWEEIREALVRFPTEKLLREYLSQCHGVSLLSMGSLVVPWPPSGEPLGVSNRSNDHRLIATAWITKGGEVSLAFETDDPGLAGRPLYFVAYTAESLDSDLLTGGSVWLRRSQSAPGRFEARWWLGHLRELGRASPTLVIRYAVVDQ